MKISIQINQNSYLVVVVKKKTPETVPKRAGKAVFLREKKKRTTIGTPRGVLIVRILYYNSQNPLL